MVWVLIVKKIKESLIALLKIIKIILKYFILKIIVYQDQVIILLAKKIVLINIMLLMKNIICIRILIEIQSYNKNID